MPHPDDQSTPTDGAYDPAYDATTPAPASDPGYIAPKKPNRPSPDPFGVSDPHLIDEPWIGRDDPNDR